MSLSIPYTLSQDYHALYERIKKGERIAAFVDHTFMGGNHVFRDIVEFTMTGGRISAYVRGKNYLHLSDFDLGLYNAHNKDKPLTLVELFALDCTRMNAGWIEPPK